MSLLHQHRSDERKDIAYASEQDVEYRAKQLRSFFDKVRNRIKKLGYDMNLGQTEDMVVEDMLPSFFAPRPGSFSVRCVDISR